jgi:RNA polymerase sigma-70 factor (ECF subfamily)
MPNSDHTDTAGVAQGQDAEDQLSLETFTQYRSLLFSLAYRMLGTVADAEDMLQETFVRWQGASREDIRSPKAFLITIVTRLCIDQLNSSRARREEYVGQWLPEPVVTDTASNPFEVAQNDESLSLAFLVLLERLTPDERAVFLLREIFDWDYSEIAEVIDQSEASCRQILRRAKQHVNAPRSRFSAPRGKPEELRREFLEAAGNGNLAGLIELLAADVTLHTDGGGKAGALPNVIHGSSKVARAVLSGLGRVPPTNAFISMAQINGEAGFIIYINEQPQFAFVLHATANRIESVYVVTNPDKLSHLPPAEAAPR